MRVGFKQFVPYVLVTLALIVALGGEAAFASNHGAGNGGDPILLRQRLIREFIASDLRRDLRDLIDTMNLQSISIPTVRQQVSDMFLRGFSLDAASSRWLESEYCIDESGQERAATTVLNVRNADICFNSLRMALENVTKAEVVALAFHEVSHHFGYADANNDLFLVAYQNVNLRYPNWRDVSSTDTFLGGVRLGVLYGIRNGVAVQACADRFSLNAQGELIKTTVQDPSHQMVCNLRFQPPVNFQQNNACIGRVCTFTEMLILPPGSPIHASHRVFPGALSPAEVEAALPGANWFFHKSYTLLEDGSIEYQHRNDSIRPEGLSWMPTLPGGAGLTVRLIPLQDR